MTVQNPQATDGLPASGLEGQDGTVQPSLPPSEDVSAAGLSTSSSEGGAVAVLQAELEQARDQVLRTLADLENIRKRGQREREDAARYAASAFAKDLLSVADNLRRAIEAASADQKGSALMQGIEATERDLLKSFEKHGIRRIDPSGAPFDPNFHEVMFEAPLPGKPDGLVFQVLEAGYVLHDRLLRPARVGVVRNTPGTHTVDQQA